jgi:hypothetical protein
MRYTDEEVIFKYIDNDYGLTKTASDLSMSHNTVRKILKHHDIEIKSAGNKTSVDVGSKVGMLTLIQRLPNRFYPSGHQDRQFLCKCDCGGEAIVPGAELRRSKKTNCGCQNRTGVIKSTYTPENYKELINNINQTPPPILFDKQNRKYKVGDIKGDLTILMKKSSGDFITEGDDLLVECGCGEYKKMTYDEFMNSTTCGCDNNG